METQALSGLKPADFQKEIDGKKTDLFFLRNIQGMKWLSPTMVVPLSLLWCQIAMVSIPM